jgi:2-polyprenyl-3-methyl-5-hydroxy-6-metoxy-1,4-benzoquinol methylase
MPTVRGLIHRGRQGVDVLRHMLHWYEPEDKLARDAQQFWSDPSRPAKAGESHWRDGLPDAVWLELGREHWTLYENFARSSGFARPARHVLEWGCGGGANAIYFAREAEIFYGVDVVQESLTECQKQMAAAGLLNLRPILFNIPEPESVLDKVAQPLDLFLCLYVFELFPTPEYGQRILRIAGRMLRPGGMAIVQIKYLTGLSTLPRRWGYKHEMCAMTSYRIDEFWQLCQSCGLEPHAVTLVPHQKLVNDHRYAYFILIKKDNDEG